MTKRDFIVWWETLADLKEPLFRNPEHDEEFDFYSDWNWDIIDFARVFYGRDMWNAPLRRRRANSKPQEGK